MSSILKGFLALLCGSTMLIAGGCHKPMVKNPTPVGAPITMPAPVDSEYRIHVGDQLDVKFFYNPELNEQLMVRPDGRISLQLVEEVMAAGRTPGELNEELKTLYAPELANPQVTVIVRSFSAHKIYVDGEVNKPGLLPLVGPMTVLQAVAQSGGLKETARRREIVVLRRTQDGQAAAIPINIDEVVDGTAMIQDIALVPYDIVYIPKSAIANVNKWVDEYLKKTILVLPQEFFLYYSAFK